MTSTATNERLTRVGPGTEMGALLRRYWHPVAALSEFDRRPTKALRVMGEDLVAYRDLSGNYGLVGRRCSHRNADLSYGIVEPEGLRCNYHGWLYNEKGTCLAMPFEDVADPNGRLRKNLRHKAYPVESRAGVLWAYMGPDPAPLLPDWEPFSWPNGFVQIVLAHVPCNWLQCQENSIDPIHFEWMHANWKTRLEGRLGAYGPTHRKLGFDEFDYGFIYRRVRDDTDENDPMWTEGRVALYPNCFFLGSHFEWRVPIDDENTLSFVWAYMRVPRDREPFKQESIPHWYGPLHDANGEWVTSHVMNQDFLAWVGQGKIADRTAEHLGKSDKGIVMVRDRLLKDIERVARGEDPKGLVRDPDANRRIRLPMTHRDAFENGYDRSVLDHDPVLALFARGFFLQYGQPEDMSRAFEAAMGVESARSGFVDVKQT